jgi:hypothetical protein
MGEAALVRAIGRPPFWNVVEYRLFGRRTVHAERAVEGNGVIAV